MMAVRHRGVVPGLGAVVRVPDDARLGATVAVRCRRKPLGRDVQRARGAVVAGHGGARRRGRGGGGSCGGRRHRGGGRRARHAARADGRRGVQRRRGGRGQRRRRGALFVQAAVHHRPPSHPGGIPRAGGWRRDAAISGHRIVVQRCGRARSHVVRDGDDGDGWSTGAAAR